jgi:hypothetical protein
MKKMMTGKNNNRRFFLLAWRGGRGVYVELETEEGRSSVADPDPGSGAFLTPGSGMGKKSGSGFGMNNPRA